MKNEIITDSAGNLELFSTSDDGTNSLIINGVEIPPEQWTGTGDYTITISGVVYTIRKAETTDYNLQMVQDTETTYHFEEPDFKTLSERQYTADAVSVPSGEYTPVIDVTLDPGKYLVLSGCQFESNASGNRRTLFSPDASTNRYNPSYQAVNGAVTTLNSAMTHNPVERTTYHLYLYQNSGSALSTYSYVRIIKL